MSRSFVDFGLKIREDKSRNYYSIWHNLKTVRLDLGPEIALEPGLSEFYDVGLGTKCNLSCPFCYVSAGSGGEFWNNPSETWKAWMSTLPGDVVVDPKNTEDKLIKELLGPILKTDSVEVKEIKLIARIMRKLNKPIIKTSKPFQIAIGSTMEPTIHPDFCKFLETVYDTGVVPNATTNGLTLSNYDDPECRKLLEAIDNFCGGIAVSYGNKSVREQARKAVENLRKYTGVKVVIHHIISDNASVDEFIRLAKDYGSDLHYHVLLPLMKHGRAQEQMTDEAYLYLTDQIKKNGIENIAVGANFAGWMKKYPGRINVYEYPSETYSKNILLKDGKVIITPSSFNLSPIQEIIVK